MEKHVPHVLVSNDESERGCTARHKKVGSTCFWGCSVSGHEYQLTLDHFDICPN